MTDIVCLYCMPEMHLDFDYLDANDVIIHRDEHTFMQQPCDVRLAAIEVNYCQPEVTHDLLARLVPHCDFIAVKSMEIDDRIFEVIQANDFTNVVWILNGVLNQPTQRSQLRQEHFHMLSTSYPYYHEWLTDWKQNIHPFKQKAHVFDVLYGTPKPHRQHLKDRLMKINRPDWFLESKFFDYSKDDFNLQDDFWEPEVVQSRQSYQCMYKGLLKNISQILPYKIYQKTAYSMVCETNFDNRWAFMTEKITKPLIACRLFIVLSSRGFLANLRDLGFKTFHGIIDESYDAEPDPVKRWDMAIDQALWLCRQCQYEIFQKILPIVMHNREQVRYLPQDVIRQEIEAFVMDRRLNSLIAHTTANTNRTETNESI